MKNRLLILCILLLNLAVTLQAETIKLPEKITISGYIPDSCMKSFDGKLEIFYHKRFVVRNWLSGKVIPVKIVKNKFSISIQPEGEISYIQIRIGFLTLPVLRSLQLDALLVNPGDSIFVNIVNDKTVVFSGKGAEKLNYQQSAGALVFSWGKLQQVDKFTPELIEYWKALADNHIKQTKAELAKLKSKVLNNTYNVLFANTMASISQQHLDHLTSSGAFQPENFDSVYCNLIKANIEGMDIAQRCFFSSDPVVLEYSSNYISYLSDFQYSYVRLLTRTKIPSFEKIFKKIIEDFEGNIRDKILAFTINRCYSLGASKFVQQALNIVEDQQSKEILQQLYDSKAPGALAYNFSFEGLDKKRMSLSDFKGKVVIIESYFNGCSGCIGLSKRMHPIIEHYKGNKNIVFISLSVDRDKKVFIAGARSGKYGASNSIYLYTNGEGAAHPMCSHYGWIGFPNTLYIDREGRIIAAQKIDPINEEKKSELIALINRYL